MGPTRTMISPEGPSRVQLEIVISPEGPSWVQLETVVSPEGPFRAQLSVLDQGDLSQTRESRSSCLETSRTPSGEFHHSKTICIQLINPDLCQLTCCELQMREVRVLVRFSPFWLLLPVPFRFGCGVSFRAPPPPPPPPREYPTHAPRLSGPYSKKAVQGLRLRMLFRVLAYRDPHKDEQTKTQTTHKSAKRGHVLIDCIDRVSVSVNMIHLLLEYFEEACLSSQEQAAS